MIPGTTHILAAALAAALALAGWQTLRLSSARADVAQARQELADYRADVAQASAAAASAALAETARRQAQLTEITAHADQQIAAARADAVRARAAADRLRIAATAAARACDAGPADPAPADAGAPATGPGLLLSDVLGRADDRAGELASALDAARAAGLACERAYDSLRR